jgi:hypothetical protein
MMSIPSMKIALGEQHAAASASPSYTDLDVAQAAGFGSGFGQLAVSQVAFLKLSQPVEIYRNIYMIIAIYHHILSRCRVAWRAGRRPDIRDAWAAASRERAKAAVQSTSSNSRADRNRNTDREPMARVIRAPGASTTGES